MEIRAVPVSERACKINETIENVVNGLVRGFDQFASPLGLGVRVSNYDDLNFCFQGGPGERMRKAHYDKSLRLLWKAEQHAPYTSFNDCTADEKALMELAEGAMSRAEKIQLKRIRSEDFRKRIDRQYTPEQKQALVNILSTIGHGEAYAWLVSADLMAQVKSTGGRSAMTMQVLEEAKHFVVLREMLHAFGCEIPRMNVWEYITLENILKQSGLEKFFGMNVIVEGLALSIFGSLASFPELDVLRLFHLDESRHTALPHNYFHDFPMTEWEKRNPITTTRRLLLLLPAIPFLLRMERDFATLGIDLFEFSGSVIRKVLFLAQRVGFHFPFPEEDVMRAINSLFNYYCSLTRENHQPTDFMAAEATRGEAELEIERAIFFPERDRNGSTTTTPAKPRRTAARRSASRKKSNVVAATFGGH